MLKIILLFCAINILFLNRGLEMLVLKILATARTYFMKKLAKAVKPSVML